MLGFVSQNAMNSWRLSNSSSILLLHPSILIKIAALRSQNLHPFLSAAKMTANKAAKLSPMKRVRVKIVTLCTVNLNDNSLRTFRITYQSSRLLKHEKKV